MNENDEHDDDEENRKNNIYDMQTRLIRRENSSAIQSNNGDKMAA
jgi:hypothetical protein